MPHGKKKGSDDNNQSQFTLKTDPIVARILNLKNGSDWNKHKILAQNLQQLYQNTPSFNLIPLL